MKIFIALLILVLIIFLIKKKPLVDNPTYSFVKNYEYVSEIVGEKINKGKTSKGYNIYEINGITYIDGYMIVNKTYGLPSMYVPENTHESAEGYYDRNCPNCINETAYKAFKEMQADAASIGLNIYIASGYRSYPYQAETYWKNVLKNGIDYADTYSARPGHSEHQTSLSFDLNTIDDNFINTLEGKWIDENAYRYGFIIRYPKDKSDETGYIYEPWHLRYVGSKLSKKLYNNGNWITMEDYFGINSKYSE